jgi:hypothetical protein
LENARLDEIHKFYGFQQLLFANNYIKENSPSFHDLEMPSPEGIFWVYPPLVVDVK